MSIITRKHIICILNVKIISQQPVDIVTSTGGDACFGQAKKIYFK